MMPPEVVPVEIKEPGGPDEWRRTKWDARRKALAVLIGVAATLAWLLELPAGPAFALAAVAVVASVFADSLLFYLTAIGMGVYLATGRKLPDLVEPTVDESLDLYRAYRRLGGEPVEKYERLVAWKAEQPVESSPRSLKEAAA